MLLQEEEPEQYHHNRLHFLKDYSDPLLLEPWIQANTLSKLPQSPLAEEKKYRTFYHTPSSRIKSSYFALMDRKNTTQRMFAFDEKAKWNQRNTTKHNRKLTNEHRADDQGRFVSHHQINGQQLSFLPNREEKTFSNQFFQKLTKRHKDKEKRNEKSFQLLQLEDLEATFSNQLNVHSLKQKMKTKKKKYQSIDSKLIPHSHEFTNHYTLSCLNDEEISAFSYCLKEKRPTKIISLGYQKLFNVRDRKQSKQSATT